MDELDAFFREDNAEATPARTDDDLDAFFAEPKQKRRTVVDRGQEIGDEIFENRFKTRSGQTSAPTLEQENRERFGEGPSWARFKYNLNRPADERAGLRRPSPDKESVDRFINQNADLAEIEKEFGVGSAGPDFRRAIQARLQARTLQEEQQRVQGTSEPIGERVIKSMPVAGSLMSIATDEEYKNAKEAVNAGNASRADIRMVAEYERSQEAKRARGETLPGALIDAASQVPKLLVGGPAVAIAGLTAEGASQRSVERGGEIYSPSNIGPSAVQNAANVLLLGKASQLAQGFKSLGGKVAGGVLADLTGQQLFDVASGKIDEYLPPEYRLDGKYGIAGQISRGELDAAGRNVLSQALMSGAFTALQSGGKEGEAPKPPEPVAKPAETTTKLPEANVAPEPANKQQWNPTGTKFEATPDGPTTFTSKTGEKYTIVREGTPGDVVIKAIDANGKTVGRVNFEKGGQTIGGESAGEDFTAGQVFVSKDRGRQGIASALYDFAAENVGTIRPSKSLSPDAYSNTARGGGEALWRANAEKSAQTAPDSQGPVPRPDGSEAVGGAKTAVDGEPPASFPSRAKYGEDDPADFVGMQKAAVQERREDVGLPPAKTKAYRSWEESTRLANESTPETIDRVIEKAGRGEALNDNEVAQFLRRQTEMDNAVEKAREAVDAAEKSGDAQAIADAWAQSDKAQKEYDAISQTNVNTGGVSGAALNARKKALARDFSEARIMFRARRANAGEPVDAKTSAEFATLSKELQASQKRIAELEDRIADMPSAEQNTGTPTNRISRRASTAKRLDDAWSEFRKVTQGKLFSNPLDPDMIVAGAKVAKAAVEHGIASARDFVDWVASREGKPLTDDQKAELGRVWNAGQAEIRNDQNQRFKQRMEKSEGASGRIAVELAKEAISGGLKDRNAIVDEVWSRMLEIDPEITRRQVMDDISGYGEFKTLNKEQLAVELRDLKGQLQQVAKLEDMAAGQAPAKTGIERRTPSAEERDLIKQVNEAKKRGGFDVTDPEAQLKSAMDAVKTRLRNQIEDMDRQLEAGQKTIKNKTKLQYDQEAIELRQQRDRLKEEFDEVFGVPGKSDAERLAVLKENIKKRNADLERRLRDEDYSKPEKKPQVAPDEELLRERVKNKKLTDKLNERIKAIEDSKRSLIEKSFRNVYEVANNVPKTLMSSIDAPVGRQALMSLLTHPIRTLRATGEGWRAFLSEDVAERAQVQLENRDNFKNGTYQRAGVDFTKVHGEEGFFSKMLDKIPNKLNYPKASERTFRTILNRVRAETFDAMAGALMKKQGVLSPADLSVIGNFVNVTTGRLSPGKIKQATQALNFAFFAPQYTVSRFFTAIGQPIWHKPSEAAPGARKAVAMEFAKAAMAVTTAAGLIKAANVFSGSDEFDVGTDPRSPDFLQVRVGNTRIDLTGGLKAWYVLMSRMWTGETLNQEGLVKEGNQRDLLSQFAMQKGSPLLSGGLELLSGKDAVNREITPAQVAFSKVSPVFLRDVIESSKDLGLPKVIIPLMFGVHGFGINTYSSDDKQLATLYRHAKKTPRPTRPEGMNVETYRQKVKDWETQKSGAQKLLDRSGKTEEEQRKAYLNQTKANRLKRLGREP